MLLARGGSAVPAAHHLLRGARPGDVQAPRPRRDRACALRSPGCGRTGDRSAGARPAVRSRPADPHGRRGQGAHGGRPVGRGGDPGPVGARGTAACARGRGAAVRAGVAAGPERARRGGDDRSPDGAHEFRRPRGPARRRDRRAAVGVAWAARQSAGRSAGRDHPGRAEHQAQCDRGGRDGRARRGQVGRGPDYQSAGPGRPGRPPGDGEAYETTYFSPHLLLAPALIYVRRLDEATAITNSVESVEGAVASPGRKEPPRSCAPGSPWLRAGSTTRTRWPSRP